MARTKISAESINESKINGHQGKPHIRSGPKPMRSDARRILWLKFAALAEI